MDSKPANLAPAASNTTIFNIRLVFPFATPSQNVLQKWHWAKRKKAHDEARIHIRTQLRDLGIFYPEPVTQRRRLEVIRWGPRLLDYGNLVGGFKPYLDALVQEGLFKDDSPAWIEEAYYQSKPRRGVGRTIMVISSCPTAPRFH